MPVILENGGMATAEADPRAPRGDLQTGRLGWKGIEAYDGGDHNDPTTTSGTARRRSSGSWRREAAVGDER